MHFGEVEALQLVYPVCFIGLRVADVKRARGDFVVMQGRTYEPGDVKDEMADAIREFNKTIVADPRVDVVALPFRDGVSIVMRK